MAAAQSASVPPALLKPGINVGRFLDGVKDASHPCCDAKDLDIIHKMGFQHIRILVEPGQMFDVSNPAAIESASLHALDNVVAYCVKLRVGVILAIALDEDRFKDKLITDKDFPGQFTLFWESFARHYSEQFPPDFIFFETKNEPGQNEKGMTDSQWRVIQANLVVQIRKSAKQNTIIATGAQNSDIQGLLALPPLQVDRVVYLFHYYEPYSFTHQGETWNESYAKFLTEQHVRYPYDADAARKAADQVKDDLLQRLYALHDMEGAARERIESDIYIVSEWAKRHGVTVICDEFGVIRPNPKAEDRAQWVTDVRTLLEKYGMGWTFWDYGSDSFGLAHGAKFDEGVVKALTVTIPQRGS